jgi:hypothetical protein
MRMLEMADAGRIAISPRASEPKKSLIFFQTSLDSFRRHPSQHVPRCSSTLNRRSMAACKTTFDTRLETSADPFERVPGGLVVWSVRALVARSHIDGEEEDEEGCQEGCQEEEGPRLVLRPASDR